MTFEELGNDNTVMTVDWDILTICQYHCPYCYARKQFEWNKIFKESEINYIISKLEKIPLKLDVNLMGGEPTLHPSLQSIIDKLNHLKNIRSVTVYSNLKSPKRIKNAFYNASFHPSEVSKEDFIKNIELYHNLVKRVTFIITEKYKDTSREVMEYIHKKYPEIILYTKFPILKGVVKECDFITPEIAEDRNFLINNKKYSFEYVYKNNLNRFKGMKCRVEYMRINVNKDIFYNCAFFKEYREYITCPYEKCENECMWSSLKYD